MPEGPDDYTKDVLPDDPYVGIKFMTQWRMKLVETTGVPMDDRRDYIYHPNVEPVDALALERHNEYKRTKAGPIHESEGVLVFTSVLGLLADKKNMDKEQRRVYVFGTDENGLPDEGTVTDWSRPVLSEETQPEYEPVEEQQDE